MDHEAIRKAVERFQHVPYYLAQSAMGVDDGGFASHYDSMTGGDFGGRFADEIGGDMMAYVLGRSGKRGFAAGTEKLFDMEAMGRFTFRLKDSPTEADYAEAAEEVADATISHVLDCFPSVGARWLEDDRVRIRDFVLQYMKAEASFAAAHADAGPSR